MASGTRVEPGTSRIGRRGSAHLTVTCCLFYVHITHCALHLDFWRECCYCNGTKFDEALDVVFRSQVHVIYASVPRRVENSVI